MVILGGLMMFGSSVFAYTVRYDGYPVDLYWDGTRFSTSVTMFAPGGDSYGNSYGYPPFDVASSQQQGAPSGTARISPYPATGNDFYLGNVTFGNASNFESEMVSQGFCTSGQPCYGIISEQHWDVTAFPDVVAHGPYAVFYVQGGVVYALTKEQATTYLEGGLTRIKTTTPDNNSIVATSTTFSLSFTGNLATGDFNGGSRVKLHVYNNVNRASNLVGPFFANMTNGQSSFDKNYIYDVPDAGGFASPTYTENIQSIGKYYMDFTIEKATDSWYNVFDWFHTTVYSTTTSFTISTTTQYDKLIEDTRNDLNKMGQSVATSTSSFCNLSSFQWYGCLNAVYMVLFVPSSADFSGYLTELNDDVYAHAPLGYIKRFQDILATTTISELPSLDYTFSTSSRSILSPILGGERIHFSPFEYATGTNITSITSDGANGLPEKNIWQITEPFYKLVLALMLIMMIIHDLTNIHAHGENVAEGSHKYGSDSEAYKEWQYTHRNS
jgi:hypothetical protein